MNIRHNISKIYKLINFDGEIIEYVEIRVDNKISHSLYKGGGFYVLYDLLEGKHTITISHEKYKTITFMIDVCQEEEVQPEILCLEWKENYLPPNKKIITGILDYEEGNQEYYYCVCTKKTTFKVVSDLEKGNQFLKMKFSEQIPLDYRMVAVASSSVIYKLKEYDFNKKAYFLEYPLEEEVEFGDSVYLLQKGSTKQDGTYEILVDTNFCDKENNISILFLYKKKQQKVTIPITRKED